jgi:hypothetical protein
MSFNIFSTSSDRGRYMSHIYRQSSVVSRQSSVVSRQSSVVSRQFNKYLTKHRSLQQLYKSFMMLAFAVVFLTSGQVMATNYFSIVPNPTLTTAALADGVTPVVGQWASSCTGATITTAFSSTAEADTFTLCGTGGTDPAVAATMGGDFGEHAASLTIQAGAKLTLSGNVTSGTDFALINNGTLVIPSGNSFTLGTTSGTYTGTGALDSTCTAGGGVWTTPATWGTVTRCGLVTAATSIVPATPGALSDVIIQGGVTAGAGTVKSLKLPNSFAALTLSGALSVTGAIIFTNTSAVLTGTGQTITLGGDLTTVAAGNIAGSPALTLTDAPHTLTIGAALTTSLGALTLAPIATTNKTIVVATNPLGVASVAGFSNCSGTSPVVATGAVPTTSPLAINTGYVCAFTPTGSTTSAPIFSTKEKATVFSEEVK